MKKILSAIVILGIVFLLPGCDFPEYYYHVVKNESSKTVSYTFNGSPTDTLEPSESMDYQSKTGKRFTGIENVDAGSPHGYGVSVKLELNGNDFTFIDIAPFNLNVANTLPIDVIIKADNYIDFNNSIEMTIASYSEESDAKIYTSNPKFTSSTNYPIKIDWNFDKDTDTVYVVIR